MKTLLHGFVAAMLACTALAAAPVLAKDAKVEAPKPPKLSKPVAVALMAAQKLMQTGDNAGAMVKIKEAEALPATAADDSFTITQVKLNIAIALKDNLAIEQSLKSLLATGRVTAEDKPKFLRNVGALAMQRKDYAGATAAFEELARLTPNDGDTIIALAELYFAQKQTTKAVDAISQAIDANTRAAQPVPENWYRRRLALAYDGKLAGAVQTSALALVQAYPNPVNWRDASVITRDSFPKLDDQIELDFMRLQAATGSLNGERDFVEYADTALGRGLPGEAKSVIEEGIRRNMLTPSKPIVVELQRTANGKVAADRASLPGLERDIKGNPKLALVTGDAYYGYGDYAKAASLYKQAIGGATVDQATANLRYGVALARAGDKAGASAALNAVKGGPREALAKYWLVWVGQAKPA